MRKILVSISLVTVVLATTASVAAVSLSDPTFLQNSNFVDENGDGICDTCEKVHHGKLFVDEDGDGICNRNVKVNHHFVDENKDEICDLCNEHNHGNKKQIYKSMNRGNGKNHK